VQDLEGDQPALAHHLSTSLQHHTISLS
jgi:hypothetical protein